MKNTSEEHLLSLSKSGAVMMNDFLIFTNKEAEVLLKRVQILSYDIEIAILQKKFQ